MSFSAETKNELARVISNDDYCNMTELAAIVISMILEIFDRG